MANHSEENPTSRPTLDCLHFQMTWTNLEVDPSERIDGVWSNLFEQGTEVACEGVIKEGASDLWKSSIPNSENPFEEEQAISLGSTTCINDHLNSSALNHEMPNASFNKSDNFSQETGKYQAFSPPCLKRPSFESSDHPDMPCSGTSCMQKGTEVACEQVIKDGASNLWKSSNPKSENPLGEETAISLESTCEDGYKTRIQDQNFATCINDHLNSSNQLNSSALSSEMLNASFDKSDNFSQEPDKYQVFSPASPNRPLRFEDETEKFEFNMKVDCDKIACTDIFPSSPRSE